MGKLAEAQDGTIFLDEIDSIPLSAQSKLLRVLEERVFEPVGSNRPQPVRARMIVATNRRLEEEVADGRFRQDLYYRLNVVEFSLRRLHEQPELIRPLARRFLSDFCAGAAAGAVVLAPGPGGPGCLRLAGQRPRAAERRRAGRGPLRGGDDQPGGPAGSGRSKIRSKQRKEFCGVPRNHWPGAGRGRAVATDRGPRQSNNCRTMAATELGISPVTLYKKLRRYGLE